nr:putative serine carboxypeptidase [Quercus suber]
MLDFILLWEGTIMAIQNMTFNNAQGFSTPPSKWEEFFVPYHEDASLSTLAGSGIFGKHHTERGLTFCMVDLAGHMIPQYAPSASYRQLEFLLGRIDSLSERSDFTTQHGDYDHHADPMILSESTDHLFPERTTLLTESHSDQLTRLIAVGSTMTASSGLRRWRWRNGYRRGSSLPIAWPQRCGHASDAYCRLEHQPIGIGCFLKSRQESFENGAMDLVHRSKGLEAVAHD